MIITISITITMNITTTVVSGTVIFSSAVSNYATVTFLCPDLTECLSTFLPVCFISEFKTQISTFLFNAVNSKTCRATALTVQQTCRNAVHMKLDAKLLVA
jgi:hypothetical protein